MTQIEVKNVCKDFEVVDRGAGLLNSVKSFFNQKTVTKHAVKDISFAIEEGELVGYIGPNGAGKSTTIKMLSGILVPSQGEIRVLGRNPHGEREKNGLDIGVVFGQRSQLFWDLPVEDAFELYQKMYKIPEEQYQKNLRKYSSMLDISEFVKQPVRQLSLGQKMRAELCVALLHDPKILYLDEPTIGLDVLVKSKIREFIKKLNVEKQTTVLLTTHDMADIEAICNRIILIDQGRLMFDGTMKEFINRYGATTTVEIWTAEEKEILADQRFSLINKEGRKQVYLFDRSEMSKAEAVKIIGNTGDIEDINIVDTKIEDIVKKLYER